MKDGLDEFMACIERMSPLVEKSECLPRMVKHFEKDINSKRDSSSIDSFERLIWLLIKRNELDPFDQSTWNKINDICQLCVNQLFYVPVRSSPPAGLAQPLHSPINEPDISKINPEVIEYLSSRISYSWRNLAKKLKLAATDIDKIESKYGSNYSACVKEVLVTYENKKWLSESGGNMVQDIAKALMGLGREYLIEEFSRLTRVNNG